MRRSRLVAAVAAVVVLAGAGVGVAVAVDGGGGHTGSANAGIPTHASRLRWNTSVPDGIPTSVVAGGGVVVAYRASGVDRDDGLGRWLDAVDPGTGARRWTASLPAGVTYAIVSGPNLWAELARVRDPSGVSTQAVVGVDLATGRVLLSRSYPSVGTITADGSGGVVTTAGTYGSWHVRDLTADGERWDGGEVDGYRVAVDTAHGIWVGARTAAVVSGSLATGVAETVAVPRGTAAEGALPESSALVDGTVLHVYGDRIAVVSLADHAVVRSLTTAASAYPFRRTAGVVLLAAPDETVTFAVDPDTGNELWRRDIGSPSYLGAPSVVLAGRGEALRGVDARTGRELWSEKDCTGFLTADTGSVVVGCAASGGSPAAVEVLSARDGTRRWRIPLSGSTVPTDAAAADGSLFVADGGGLTAFR